MLSTIKCCYLCEGGCVLAQAYRCDSVWGPEFNFPAESLHSLIRPCTASSWNQMIAIAISTYIHQDTYIFITALQ